MSLKIKREKTFTEYCKIMSYDVVNDNGTVVGYMVDDRVRTKGGHIRGGRQKAGNWDMVITAVDPPHTVEGRTQRDCVNKAHDYPEWVSQLHIQAEKEKTDIYGEYEKSLYAKPSIWERIKGFFGSIFSQ